MPDTVAIPCATGLPSAIISLASTAIDIENDSPGIPRTASGFPRVAADCGCVQLCVIVSGLYWKMMTFGSGTRNVGMNWMRAPRMYLPAISDAPFDAAQNLGGDSVHQIAGAFPRARRDFLLDSRYGHVAGGVH